MYVCKDKNILLRHLKHNVIGVKEMSDKLGKMKK